MVLRSILSYFTFAASVQIMTALEFYTRTTIHVKPERILEVKTTWGQAECVLGCKNYKGCVTSSFKKHSETDATGNCTFYSGYRTEQKHGDIVTVGFVFAGDFSKTVTFISFHLSEQYQSSNKKASIFKRYMYD